MLHELVHVALSSRPRKSDDWLVEGLAEYYSLEILRRTGGISQGRFDRTLLSLAAWVEREHAGLTNPSRGANTAYAVLMLHELDVQARSKQRSFDEIVSGLVSADQFTGVQLAEQLRRLGLSTDTFETWATTPD
jgi:hypothetical protein